MKSGKFYAGDNYIFCMVSVAEMPFTFLLVQSDLTYVSGLALGLDRRGALLLGAVPVSYTHLTLPTIA